MTNYKGTITLDISQYMDYGLDVYDAESSKVGSVDSYDRNAGYMMVKSNPFSDRDLYIPFSAITHIDPREVFVSKSRDELHREYSSPPPRNTLIEEKIDPDTGEDDSRAITSEPSGFDGTSIEVRVADFGKLAHHIAPGFRVYDLEMEIVGTVKQYDRESKQMLVERGTFAKSDIMIPVALVDSVNREKREIYLVASSEMINRIITSASGPRFTEAERKALKSLRTEYQTGRHLFTAGELAHLRFLRWLVNRPGWNSTMDQPCRVPESHAIVWKPTARVPGFIG